MYINQSSIPLTSTKRNIMKNTLITSLMLLFSTAAFAQDSVYTYGVQLPPSVNHEKLLYAQYVSDIAPTLWNDIVLPYKERVALDERKKTQGYYSYKTFIDYASVVISATHNKKVFTAESSDDNLTIEQQRIVANADLNTDIVIKIKYNYKILAKPMLIEGTLTIKVVPETEAEYIGGLKLLSSYLLQQVIDKISSRIMKQPVVEFTINEEGQAIDVKLNRTTGDAKTDAMVIDAIQRMPKWNPAKNAKGIPVKQRFTIPLGGGC